MEVRSHSSQENMCIFFRQYFCCRKKRQWNPINQRKSKIPREKSRVTFAVKVNKVEPIHYEESCSDDNNSEHKFTYEQRLPTTENNIHTDENTYTTALLNDRLSDSSPERDDSECEEGEDSEYEEGEILTLEAFVEKYVKDTISAALIQWKKDLDREKHKLEVQEIGEEEPE